MPRPLWTSKDKTKVKLWAKFVSDLGDKELYNRHTRNLEDLKNLSKIVDTIQKDATKIGQQMFDYVRTECNATENLVAIKKFMTDVRQMSAQLDENQRKLSFEIPALEDTKNNVKRSQLWHEDRLFRWWSIFKDLDMTKDDLPQFRNKYSYENGYQL